MIYGIGTDIVAISRFQRFLTDGNDSLFARLFTEEETAYCSAKRSCAQHYALRFAAKEAFLKALGIGLRDGLSWKDISVVNDSLGKPDLHLTGRAAEIFREQSLSKIFLSLSHDGDSAVAMVVLERA